MDLVYLYYFNGQLISEKLFLIRFAEGFHYKSRLLWGFAEIIFSVRKFLNSN
jgi:hypothetical protein